MAATVELEDKDSGEKRWFYTVDAKEQLRAPGNTWKMTGEIKRSGWATPSAQTSNPSKVAPAPTQAEQIASGIAAGLATAFGNSVPEAPVAPEAAPDESAGLPPEDEEPGESSDFD